MVVYEYSWLFMVVHSSCMVVRDCVWLFMVIHDCSWLFMVIHDCLWLFIFLPQFKNRSLHFFSMTTIMSWHYLITS